MMTDSKPKASYPAGRPKFPRLHGFDYSQPGNYYATMVSAFRECLFGQIRDGQMILSPIGEIIREEWLRSPQIRREIELGEFVIMPNHLHAIVRINPTVENDDLLHFQTHGRARLPDVIRDRRKPHSLGSFIAGFKAYSTKRINEVRGTPGARVWQPDCFESILRTGHAYHNAAQHILNNPLSWETDKENLLCSK
jgi:REP element-mobilizing transposase RayT